MSVQLPASKSISNRLLVIQKIAKQDFVIQNLSTANDTLILKEILGNKNLSTVINCHDAGTVYRFMTCFCATEFDKTFFVEGTERLLNRPMRPLLDCLVSMGAEIDFVIDEDKKSSLTIQAKKLQNKELMIAGDVSSQFISGLCLIASRIENGLSLQIEEPVFSKPYIDLTLNLLEEFGVKSTFDKNHIRIEQQEIIPKDILVENDWSSATFFYCYMMLSDNPQTILLEELAETDIQGDKFIASLSEDFGIKTTFTKEGALLNKTNSKAETPSAINLSDYPDLAIPFLVACAFKFPKVRFQGLAHLRSKESDRIEALRLNLENFGILLKEQYGDIWFEKLANVGQSKIIEIETFNDHRIAMSFSLLAVLGYEIQLDNIDCIAKSFPDFLAQISKLGICPKK